MGKLKFFDHLLTLIYFQIDFLSKGAIVELLFFHRMKVVNILFHRIEKNSLDILLKFFCVLPKKESHMVWNNMRVSKWWQNFHFWAYYPLNMMKGTEQIYISLCIAANPSKEMFHNPVKRCARQEKNCKTFRKQTSLLMTRRISWINLLLRFCLFQHCRFTLASFIWEIKAKIAFSLSHHIQSNNTSLNLSQVDLLFRTKLLYLFIVLLIFQNCYLVLCKAVLSLSNFVSHTTTNILSPFICQFWVCIIRALLIWIPNCTIKTSHCYVKLFR